MCRRRRKRRQIGRKAKERVVGMFVGSDDEREGDGEDEE